MAWLDPRVVTLEIEGAEHRLEGVRAVAIDRGADRMVVERSDEGPHVVFADAVERRETIRIARLVERSEADLVRALEAGAECLFEARVGAAAGDAGGVVIRASAVVQRVEHDLRGEGAPAQRITLLVVSTDGIDSGVTIEEEG